MGYLTYNDFKIKTNVNKETLEKLKTYLKLIKIWQKKFNLISQKSFNSVWERHFLDSYQFMLCGAIGGRIPPSSVGRAQDS